MVQINRHEIRAEILQHHQFNPLTGCICGRYGVRFLCGDLVTFHSIATERLLRLVVLNFVQI